MRVLIGYCLLLIVILCLSTAHLFAQSDTTQLSLPPSSANCKNSIRVGVGYFWDRDKLENVKNMNFGRAIWIEGAHTHKSGLTLAGRFSFEEFIHRYNGGVKGHIDPRIVIKDQIIYSEEFYVSVDFGVSKALRLADGHFVEPLIGIKYLREFDSGNFLELLIKEDGLYAYAEAEMDIHNEICLAVGFSYYYRSKSGYCLGMRTGFNKWIGIPWLMQKYFTPFVGLYF